MACLALITIIKCFRNSAYIPSILYKIRSHTLRLPMHLMIFRVLPSNIVANRKQTSVEKNKNGFPQRPSTLNVDMDVKERLKEAFENVLYSADRTWTDTPSAYHEANLELCLREQKLRNKQFVKVRPRTVRDTIPQSRLAQYSNYEYNESREMSYTFNFPNYRNASSSSGSSTLVNSTEIWQTPEVDELYNWFMTSQPEEKGSDELDFSSYESPLLRVDGLADKILKCEITGEAVKNIWKDEKLDEATAHKSFEIPINLYKTPLNKFYLIPKSNTSCPTNQHKQKKIDDLEQTKQLSEKVKRKIKGISRYLKAGTFDEIKKPVSNSASTEILYSEVVQGIAPGKKQASSSIKTDHAKAFSAKKSVAEPKISPSIAQGSRFSNHKLFGGHRSSSREDSVKRQDSDKKREKEEFVFVKPKPGQVRYIQNSVPKIAQTFPGLPENPDKTKSAAPNNHASRAVPPCFSAQQSNMNVQSFSHYRYPCQHQCFLDRQTRNAFVHPFSTSCFQQTYYYSPMPPVQRWLHPNFPSSCYPTQIYHSSWITQNQMMPQRYDANRNPGATAANPERSNSQRNDVPAVQGDSAISSVDAASGEDESAEENPDIESIAEEHELSASEKQLLLKIFNKNVKKK